MLFSGSNLRRRFLGTEEAAKRAMGQLAHDASTKGITQKELMIKVPYCSKGGIKSWELVRVDTDLLLETCSHQTFSRWRRRMKSSTNF